jgi:hypothetical protein
MRRLLLLALIPALLFAVGARSDPRPSLADLGGGVIGALGVPLGTIVTLEGEIVDGSSLAEKALSDRPVLMVESVDGTPLAAPVLLTFTWFAGAESAELSGRVTLIAYETGGFEGVPDGVFAHVPAVAAQSFHFASTLVLLKAI